MQLVNFAAWLPSEGEPLEVATATFPDLGPDELIVKNRAVAINPVDWKIQRQTVRFPISYPAILGEDLAGTVLEVGKDVKCFKKGDTVIAHALGLGNGPAYGAFQLYPRVKVQTVAKTSLQPLDGVVLPLSISTAAAGLYLKSTLGLRYPTFTNKSFPSEARKKPEVLLLWGGSSSVGSSVIQLAVASGYHILTTASPANYQYAKDLGASFVVDYHNPDVIDILISLVQAHGWTVVGAYDAIGSDGTVSQCAAVLHALGGGSIASVGSAGKDVPAQVHVARISSSNIVSEEGGKVAKKVWAEYLPAALGVAPEQGGFKAAPQKLVVGRGLYYVQEALDRQAQGVSARKVVVEL
jgi:NADPH:quinone reductase-like Zn-dependent oxidoreductase